MTDDRYDRVQFRGVTVDKYTRAALLAVEKQLGYELTLWQGSYHKGVSKSAGTHDGGGVVDLNGYYDAPRKVEAMRDHGFVCDLRNQPSLSNEIHCVQIGNEKVAPSAKRQIAPMKRGRAGLARDVPQVIKYTPPGGYKAFDYHGVAKPVAGPVVENVAHYRVMSAKLYGYEALTAKKKVLATLLKADVFRSKAYRVVGGRLWVQRWSGEWYDSRHLNLVHEKHVPKAAPQAPAKSVAGPVIEHVAHYRVMSASLYGYEALTAEKKVLVTLSRGDIFKSKAYRVVNDRLWVQRWSGEWYDGRHLNLVK